MTNNSIAEGAEPAAAASTPFWKTNSARILLALALGLALGILSAGTRWSEGAITVASFVGNMWLNALKMTIIPLIVGLLITGIVQTAEAARAGRVTARAVIWFLVLLWGSTLFCAFYIPAILSIFPIPQESAAALKAALSGADKVEEVPTIFDFLRGLIPTNVFKAAVEDGILPIIIFTTMFAFAMTKINRDYRQSLATFFAALTDAMVVMIHWILLVGPLGVFGLAYVVAAQTGAQALGALAHYVAVVSSMGILVFLFAYVFAVLVARIPLGRFAKAVIPAQVVAISTQSSLASLPAMLRGTEMLGVRRQIADVVLPLAVALYRATSPSMNLAVAFYVAHWYGIEITPAMLIAGVATAALTTMGSVSLPGTVSFVASIAPICIAMGLPVEPLALLIAVETIPDIFRTVGNVTMNVGLTAAIDRQSAGDLPASDLPADDAGQPAI